METKNNQKVTPNGLHPFSSSGIFSSLFAYQSPMVLGRESVRGKGKGKTVNNRLEYINRSQDDISKIHENQSHTNKVKVTSSIFQDQIIGPCNLSSSIYYGGQDILYPAQNARLTSLKKYDWENDDSGVASRGDWWKDISQNLGDA
ncbi:uncharacterized protein [Medicago truncatula]|uniref:uncharacterized protein n=1 Tax=Medicago truncatula TaxID=3880 RepID=UPI000D2F31E7|nr:uncharacterized protein LOC11421446 [Medicago truncatula]